MCGCEDVWDGGVGWMCSVVIGCGWTSINERKVGVKEVSRCQRKRGEVGRNEERK